MAVSPGLDKAVRILNWAAAILLVACLLMVFFFAPTELTMGNLQRILYFHVGSAWVSALAFLMALVSGVWYLRRPDRRWDIISVASVEIGLVFATMTIVSGSTWAGIAWNAWWDWSSPRLVSYTVMWLVYVAYFMLRGSIEDEEKRARFAAVYVIAAFVTVVFTFLSIRFLRDVHPTIFGEAADATAIEGESEFASPALAARMGVTLLMSTVTFTVLYLAWLANRYRLQLMLDEAAVLKARVLTRLQQ